MSEWIASQTPADGLLPYYFSYSKESARSD